MSREVRVPPTASTRVDTEIFQLPQEEKGGRLRGSGFLIDLSYLRLLNPGSLWYTFYFLAVNLTRPFEMLVEGVRGNDTLNLLPKTTTSS